MSLASPRYSNVAMILHWTIALLVIGQIALIMGVDAKGPSARTWAMLHKADGLLILLLTVVRLAWRLSHRPPPAPAGMSAWQRFAAKATHVLFYVLLFAFPLTGWAASSALGRPITFYGVFNWPLLPVDGGEALAGALMDIHRLGAKLLYVLLALHVGAALKHHFIDRDDVLRSMLPGTRR